MATENLSSLLLIAVVLIGSIAVYGAATPLLTQRSATVLAVESAEAQVNPTDAVAVINVKNTAAKQIRLIELKVQVEGCDVAHFNVDVPPGSSYSLVLRNPPGRWTAGEVKNAAITAVFSDGSTASIVASIRVYGSGWVGAEENPIGGQSSGSQEGSPGGSTGSPAGGSQAGNQTAGNQTGGSSGGQTGGKTVIFADDFQNGLSGWQPWGTASGLAVEVDMHGKPSPSLHVYAGGSVGTLAGASKEVDVNLASPATLTFAFDYNVHALKDKGIFPGNLWVRVLGPSGNVLVDEKVYEATSADSGWKSATVTIPPVTGRITLIVYMQILSSKGQEFWMDNAVLDA